VPSRVIRNPLCVVAGRSCNHATRALVTRQCEQFIQRPALFERPGALLVVQLKKDGILGQPGKSLRMCARRDADICTNPVEGGMDIRELNHCRGKVAQSLEPPERSTTDEEVMLARLARRSQRENPAVLPRNRARPCVC